MFLSSCINFSTRQEAEAALARYRSTPPPKVDKIVLREGSSDESCTLNFLQKTRLEPGQFEFKE